MLDTVVVSGPSQPQRPGRTPSACWPCQHATKLSWALAAPPWPGEREAKCSGKPGGLPNRTLVQAVAGPFARLFLAGPGPCSAAGQSFVGWARNEAWPPRLCPGVRHRSAPTAASSVVGRKVRTNRAGRLWATGDLSSAFNSEARGRGKRPAGAWRFSCRRQLTQKPWQRNAIAGRTTSGRRGNGFLSWSFALACELALRFRPRSLSVAGGRRWGRGVGPRGRTAVDSRRPVASWAGSGRRKPLAVRRDGRRCSPPRGSLARDSDCHRSASATWAWGNQFLWGYRTGTANDAGPGSHISAGRDLGLTSSTRPIPYGTGPPSRAAVKVLARGFSPPLRRRSLAGLLRGHKLASFPWRWVESGYAEPSEVLAAAPGRKARPGCSCTGSTAR